MRTLRFYGIFSLAALWALSGCGEPFTATAASSSSSSGSGGDGGAGGAGGDGGGGAATTSSSSSAGGGGEGGCGACKEGEFCTASETCVRCADRSGALSFGTPMAIEVEGTAPAFPRVREEPGDEGEATQRLVYVATFGSDDTQIATATGRPWTAGEVVASVTVNSPESESGPLLLPLDALSPRDGFPRGSLLFDRVLAGPGSLQSLFVADALEATHADAFDALHLDGGSYSVAVAHGVRPYRYWFMNKHQDDGGTTSRLVTKLAEDAGVQVLDIMLPGDCPAKGDNLAPWVTPDGGVLFFQAPYSARGDCAQASVLRSFYVKLGADGLPADGQKAKMLLPSLKPEIAVMTPSLSPDECTLYLASDLNMMDRRQRLYAASRR